MPDNAFGYLPFLMNEVSSSVEPHSIRKVSHRRRPFRVRTMYLSGCFYMLELLDLISENSNTITPKWKKSFDGYEEVATANVQRKTLIERLLQAAEKGAEESYEQRQVSKITSKSFIECSVGQGRATREPEFMWYPSLIGNIFGKMIVRFYVSKADLQNDIIVHTRHVICL